MTRRSPGVIALVAGLIVAVAAGGYGLWYLFLREAGPPPVSLQTPAATTATSSPSGASASPVPGTAGGGDLSGTWTVDQSIGSFSDFSDSFVGYRVQEQLAGVGANTAVGRTPDVTGSLTLAGSKITAVEVTATLTTLQSDDPRRDGRLAEQGIQTAQFPTATFKLTAPIDLGSVPGDGATFKVTATGDLALHGVTKSVQIALQAHLAAGIVTVAGSLEILFADYGIERPTSFAVLSVDDHGTMEFQLQLRHA